MNADLALVVSDVPGAAALDAAGREGIPTSVVEYSREAGREAFGDALARACRAHDISFVALAGFMRILPPGFLDHYRDRVLNIHPSLLPSFPGLRAQEQALEAGVSVSGCTVHLVDAGVDTGPIVSQVTVPVYADDDEPTLSARILRWEHRLYPRVISMFASGRIRVENGRVKISNADQEGVD